MNLNIFSRYQKKKAGDRTTLLRKHSIDAEVFDYVFVEKYHRPTKEITNPAPVILDLGVNIGLTVVDFKLVYPGCTIYGYELDSDNFHLAQKNCRDLGGVHLYNKAVWKDSNGITYKKSGQVDAYKVDANAGAQSDTVHAPSITIADMIREHGLTRIDYVKMDIEGAEYEVFQQDTSWLDITDQIKIEIHYDAEMFKFFEQRLRERGFEAIKDTHHWTTLIGYKK